MNSGVGWERIRLRMRCSKSLAYVLIHPASLRSNVEDLDCGRRFIPDIKKIKLIKSFSPNAEVWTLYYELSPFVSPRVFTVLQVKRLNEVDSRREGCVLISFPYPATRTEG